MPVKADNIDWEEIGKIAGATIIPFGLCALSSYMWSRKKDQEIWFKTLSKPSWVIGDEKVCSLVGIAVAAPLGYASHLVCKHARGTERQIALGLYGAGLLTWAAGIPAFTQTKDLKCWFGVTTLLAGLAGATAFTFYKINETAGLLMVPMAAWCAYSSISMAALIQANPNAGTDWTPKK